MVCIGVGSTLTASVALAPPAAAALTVQAATLAVEAVTLAVQAADAAAAAALGVIVGAGAKLAGEGEEQFEAETTSRRWHMAAAEAVGMNAAIRMLAARARRVGVAVVLPEPIVLDRRSLDDVSTWLAETTPELRRVREELAGATLSAERERLMAELPIAVDRTAVGDALRRYAETLAHGRARAEAAAHADLSWVDAEVQDALAGVDPDAAADDRAQALRSAARVAQQTDEADADAYLDALNRMVRTVINPRAAATRRAARWLEGLEHPAVAAAAESTLPVTQIAKELAEVVAGSAELTPDLRDRAQRAAVRAARLVQNVYRADLLQGLVADRGYNVAADGSGRLRVTHPDWGAEHTASVWLDDNGCVHHLLVGASRPGGDVAATEEQARNGALGRDLAAAAHDMTHMGVHGIFVEAHEIQHHHPAGAAREPTVVARPAYLERRRT